MNDKPKRQTLKVQDRSGLFLVIEPKSNKCKRFIGVTRFPKGQIRKFLEDSN